MVISRMLSVDEWVNMFYQQLYKSRILPLDFSCG